MSYIEKKYYIKIQEIFDSLLILENSLFVQLNKKTVKNGTDIAKLCSNFNRSINLILKKCTKFCSLPIRLAVMPKKSKRKI